MGELEIACKNEYSLQLSCFTVIALLLVLIIYPVSFSKELKTSKYH